jgi:hypothetical protein
MPPRVHKRQIHHLLSFAEFKAQLSERRQSDIYNSKVESFPDDPWYALEHEQLNRGIRHMCDDLLQSLDNVANGHSELENLQAALRFAAVIPRGKSLHVAFLGEQGIGKSSIINAIFDRQLVNVSGLSSACTAYPTIITYKEGAKDNTTSDIRIEFLNMQEFRDATEEQIRRYVAAFPFKDSNHSTSQDLKGHASDEDEDEDMMSTESLSDQEPVQVASPRTRTKVSGAVLRGAKNARAYFEIIFNASYDESQRLQLEHFLENTNIESSDFLDYCLTMIESRLAELEAEEGHLSFTDIADEELPNIWNTASMIYPLVKVLHLATDHILLKNNMCVLDLPGKLEIIRPGCSLH